MPWHARAPAERLLSGLAATQAALAARDPFAASAALDVVLTSCAELDSSGARLDGDTLGKATLLHRACTAHAVPLQEELSAKLEHAAGARRAATAYGR